MDPYLGGQKFNAKWPTQSVFRVYCYGSHIEPMLATVFRPVIDNVHLRCYLNVSRHVCKSSCLAGDVNDLQDHVPNQPRKNYEENYM